VEVTQISQPDVFTEYTNPEIYASLQEDGDGYVKGRVLRFVVGMVFILYATIAFTIDLKMGFYGYKIMIMASTALLAFNPANYPYLLGLLVPIYYPLKGGQYAMPGYNYMVQFSSVMIILMVIYHLVWKNMAGYRRNPYHRFDVGSFCLLGIGIFALLGGLVSVNRFLYVHRAVDIIAFGCAFYLGRSCLNVSKSLKMFLVGLALGITAFFLPVSVGFVFRRGIYVLGHLHEIRIEMGLGETMAGAESGTLLTVFVLAYTLYGSRLSPMLGRIALWMVAVPAAVVIVLYLSRAAVLLLPVTVLLNFVFSKQRLRAVFMALAFILVGVLILVESPGIVYGIIERMGTFSSAALIRKNIRIQAVMHGLSHPLLGMGAGQFPVYYVMATAHNEPLNFLAEQGAIAFLLYMTFLAYFGYMAVKLRVSTDVLMQSMGGVFLSVLLIYFVYTQIQPIYNFGGGPVFTFVAGMLSTLYYRDKAVSRAYQEL
jgi:hypothetical protein